MFTGIRITPMYVTDQDEALRYYRDTLGFEVDSDVDLGYVSRRTHPLDVVRESYRLQRTLREQGFAVDR